MVMGCESSSLSGSCCSAAYLRDDFVDLLVRQGGHTPVLSPSCDRGSRSRTEPRPRISV